MAVNYEEKCFMEQAPGLTVQVLPQSSQDY